MSDGIWAPHRRIEVVDRDIESGMPRNSGTCMIAEGIKRAFPHAQYVAVDVQTIRWTDKKKGLRYIYLTPRVAQIALVKYDQGERPRPFSFELRYGQVVAAGHSRLRGGKRKRKAKLVRRGKGNGTVPVVIGGRAPPRVHAGNRREFGMRAYAA